MSAPAETPRERFLRNHQEHLGVMKAARARAVREGRGGDAETIGRVIAAWESAAESAGAGPDGR